MSISQIDNGNGGVTRFLLSLVKCMQQYPISYVVTPQSIDSILTPVVEEGKKYSPNERVTFACILYAEYICRKKGKTT